MLIQQALIVSTAATAAKPYVTPQLSHFGSIRSVTSASVPASGNKTGNAIEGNPGGGGGDVWRP